MDGYGKRVLIVDDDEHIRLLMGLVLEEADYNVVAVSNGSAALSEIHKRHFDAVITDWSVPIVNGLELLERIHAVHPETPVILVSGDFPDNPRTPGGVPFFACLRKPFENAALLRLIRAAVHMAEGTSVGNNSVHAAFRHEGRLDSSMPVP